LKRFTPVSPKTIVPQHLLLEFQSFKNERHTIRKKDGKVHRYWCLVRSVRVGRRVIQVSLASNHYGTPAQARSRCTRNAPVRR
jgi:hypothetical protein